MKEKMIKCAYYFRGFMRMSTMIILLILMVTFYFYQDKIKEISGQLIENNKKNGTLFYVEGIWAKMKGVQKMQDDRNQNAVDITGKTKKISEKNGLYSFEIPESWDVTSEQSQIGKQLSMIVISNKNFSKREVGNDIFYDNGAELTVKVFSGELADAKNQDGNHGKMLIGKEPIVISGENIFYHRIIASEVKNGEILDAHILHGGKTFEIHYVYNKQKFNEGEFLFTEIMNSFKFDN